MFQVDTKHVYKIPPALNVLVITILFSNILKFKS